MSKIFTDDCLVTGDVKSGDGYQRIGKVIDTVAGGIDPPAAVAETMSHAFFQQMPIGAH